MKTIRLMLVDDHELVRTGLRAYLESQAGFQVVAEASDGEEALRLALKSRPDVIVMDIGMPKLDGLQATRRLRVLCPECQVLALTVHQDKQFFFEMLAAGAVGYVTKHAAAEDLVDAIHSVANGNVFLQPALARWLLEDYRRLLASTKVQSGEREARQEAFQRDLAVLSRRELQVLEGVAQGRSNQLIGEQLNISPRTVARHRERIMNKLNLHSSTELVKFAIKTGLIEIS
jgi:DNA-binding NarL/FixJ family response regulator